MNDPSAPPPLAAEAEPVQVVRSAEQVALHLPIAGPGSRILAYSIDYLIIVALQFAFIMLLVFSTPLLAKLIALLEPMLDEIRAGKSDPMAANGAMLLILAFLLLSGLVIELAYFLVSEALSGGRSIGKAAIGLRVVGEDGFPLTRRSSLVRNLLRAVDILPGSYVVGLIAILVSARAQRLGDLAAGTLVVRLDRAAAALPIEPRAETIAAFRFSRAQLALLGANEKALLRQTLRRVDELEAERVVQILARTADVLGARLGVAAVAPAERERFLLDLLRALDGAA